MICNTDLCMSAASMISACSHMHSARVRGQHFANLALALQSYTLFLIRVSTTRTYCIWHTATLLLHEYFTISDVAIFNMYMYQIFMI